MKQAPRRAEELIAAAGVSILSKRANRHIVYKCRRGLDTFNLVVPVSPSDWRWEENLRQVIRRYARGGT